MLSISRQPLYSSMLTLTGLSPAKAVLATAILLALSSMTPSPSWATTPAATAEKESVDLDVIRVEGKRRDGYDAGRSSSATRTDTPLQDVPQAITVITGQQLHDRATQTMSEAVRYVPGVGILQGEGNRDGLVFRGNSSTADFFVDGLRDDVQYYRDTYNIARIEALKGPNAMIFGRGSPGGLLNRVTRVADWGEQRDVSLQLGSWQKRRATADFGHSANDTLAFRATGLHENSDGFRDGTTLERSGVNPTLALRAGDSTLITLGYEYFRDKRTADRGIPSLVTPFNGTRYPVVTERETFFGDPNASRSRTEVDAFTALVEHDFGNGTVLRNRLRYAAYDKYYRNVYPDAVNAAATTVDLLAYDNTTERRNLFNQTDLVFSANTGAVEHKFMTGFEYGRQHSGNLRRSGLFAIGPGTPCLNAQATPMASKCIVPLSAPNVAPRVTYANQSAGGNGDAHNEGRANVFAVYLQDQIEFTKTWSAILGMRYDRFDIDFDDLRNGVAASRRSLSSSDGLWSPRAGLIFKPIEALSLYASYGIGYLPRSGEQMTSLAFNSQALDPEEFENIEVGAKWQLRTGLSMEAAVFRLNRSNAAVTDPADSTRLILLGDDSQRIDGLEWSLAGTLTDHWQMIASYAWQDARTLRAVGSTPAGRMLPQTPETAAGLWNRYDVNDRWGVGFGASYRSESFATISNAVTLKSYTRYDGAVYYRFNDRLSAQLNVENVFDKVYYPSAHNDNNITVGTPRAAYVSIDIKF